MHLWRITYIYINLFYQELDGSNTEPVPVFILGNKSDLDSSRVVDTEQGEKVRQLRTRKHALTQWDRDKMGDFSQAAFSHEFCWMKM